MNKVAVIGGSRFASLKNLVITHSTTVKTPYGDPSAILSYGILGEREVVYLPRRGSSQPIPPHNINYRANIWALRDAGVQAVIATAAVGGIHAHFKPGKIVIPDQLIDYTYGRENTYFGEDSHVNHIEFADPYSAVLREHISQISQKQKIEIITKATYAITQGPRLETIAEVGRLSRDGCHIVGMTGMPEAALARELDLEYACIALVVDYAAGGPPFTEEDEAAITQSEMQIEKLVEALIMRF